MAILGEIDQFIPLMQLEAQYQALDAAPKVVWLSDGGRGDWRVFRTCFAHCAIPVLDFYHAAGHRWRATTALFDEAPQSNEAKAWFHRWRHQLRHGQHHQVLASLTRLVNTNLLSGKSLVTLIQVQAYFQRHHRHIRYQHQGKRISNAIDSWVVEFDWVLVRLPPKPSACKHHPWQLALISA